MFQQRQRVSVGCIIIKGGCMKRFAVVVAGVFAIALNTHNGSAQVQSSQELIAEERGSPWISQPLTVERVPLTTGRTVDLSVVYHIRTSAGVCEVFLQQVQVADRSQIQGALLNESFYRHIYTAIARRHAGTGTYPFMPELASTPSGAPTHVFKRGMMMSWNTPQGSANVIIEQNRTSALCASSYSFQAAEQGLVAKHHGTEYNIKHTQQPFVSEVR
jgi:hypothetical protein